MSENRVDLKQLIMLIKDNKNFEANLILDEGCILKIVSNMFGEEMQEINHEISDAVGELTNMISGQARQEIEKTGKILQGAIPTVITGKNHKLISMTKGPKIAIPFKTDTGSFTVEVCLEG